MHTVALEDVVVGDLVVLEMGTSPADGRILKASELYIDQSLMTGESEPVRKLARPGDTADGRTSRVASTAALRSWTGPVR